MKQNAKPSKGTKTPATKNTKPSESAPSAAPAAQPKPAEAPQGQPAEKPAPKPPKAEPGQSKLQIITTDLTGKTDWTHRFALAIRGEGEQFLPGWSITQFPSKEARDAEIASLSEGIDKIETRVNPPVTLNGKQVFFLRWKGGHREAKA